MNLATLFVAVDLDASKFNTGVSNTLAESKSFAQKIGADADSIKSAFTNAFSFSVGQLMADGFKQALGAGWEFIQEGVQLATDLQETNTKIDTIYGDMAGSVHAWAKTTKEQYGIGEAAAKEYAAGIAGLLSTDEMNMTPEEIYKLSTSLVALAGDLASFHNISIGAAYEGLQKALGGSAESLMKIGLDTRDTLVAAHEGYIQLERSLEKQAQEHLMKTNPNAYTSWVDTYTDWVTAWEEQIRAEEERRKADEAAIAALMETVGSEGDDSDDEWTPPDENEGSETDDSEGAGGFYGTIIVNVYLDGEELGDIITERVEANMNRETSTKSKTGG